MLKDLILGGTAALIKSERILNNPLNIQVEPTTYCNLKCKMCIRHDSVATPFHMEENILHLAVKKLSPSKIVFAGAGEPLLNPVFPEMVEYCVKAGIKTMVSTNLVIDKTTIDRLLATGIHVIKVSIDAPDRDTYSKVRGKAEHFDKLLDNLTYIQQHKDNQLDLRFEYVIMKDNFDKIPEMLSLAKRMGIRGIYFRELQTEGISEERRKDLMDNFDFSGLKKILQNTAKAAKKMQLETNLEALLYNFDRLTDIYSRETRPDTGASCLLPWLQIFVAVNGDVSPCCALYTNNGVKSGNVVDNSRDEILNGPAMTCIRRAFKNKKLPAVCRDCIPRDFKKLLLITRSLPGF